MTTSAYIHSNPRASETELEQEAREAFASSAVRQTMAELYELVRELKLPWRTPKHALDLYTVEQRFTDMSSNPYARAAYLKVLIPGIPPKMALRMDADAQAQIVLEGMKEDFTHEYVEEKYLARNLALYANLAVRYFELGDALPWNENRPAHKQLLKTLFASALNSDRTWKDEKLAPIITAHDLLSSINDDHWEEYVSRATRAKIRRAMLDLEKLDASKPHTAAMTLDIITLEGLVGDLPVECLHGPFDFIGKKMGFARPAAEEAAEAPKSETTTADEGWSMSTSEEAAPPKAEEAPAPAEPGASDAAAAEPTSETTAEAKEEEDRPTFRPLPPEAEDGPKKPETSPEEQLPPSSTATPTHPIAGAKDDAIVIEINEVVESSLPTPPVPPESREGSSPDLKGTAREKAIHDIVEGMKKAHGLDFSEYHELPELYRVKKLLEGRWNGKEQDDRLAMAKIMKALGGVDFDEKVVETLAFPLIKAYFFEALRTNPKFSSLADRLAGSIRMTVPTGLPSTGQKSSGKPPPLPGTGTGGNK